MKKRVLSWLLTILLVFSLVTPADKAYAAGNEGSGSEQELLYETVFPDAAFRTQVLAYGFDADHDGIIDDDELEAMAQYESIAFSPSQYYPDPIVSLEGIGLFTGLKSLHVAGYDLESLDISKNTQLKVLYCEDCGLESLDISKNTQLKELNCKNNQIETLDLGVNSLTNVWCQGNPGITIDIQNHALLNQAYIDALAGPLGIIPDSNGNLCVSAAEWIEEEYRFEIYASVTYSQDATVLYTEQDPGEEEKTLEELFPDPTFRAFILYEFDKNGNAALEENEWGLIKDRTDIILSTGSFETYDVKPIEDSATIETLQGIEFFTNLTLLVCDGRGLNTLDISKNTKLQILSCRDNDLKELDVDIATIYTAYCQGNPGLKLNIGSNDALNKAYNAFLSNGGTVNNEGYCEGMYFEVVEGFEHPQCKGALTFDPDAEILRSSGSQEEQDLYEDAFPDENFRKIITWLYDHDNDGVIDADEKTEMETDSNLFLSPEAFYNFPDDQKPIADEDTITDLTGVELFTSLQMLTCSERGLERLDISNNTNLSFLSCANNNLQELDLGIESLQSVYCFGNEGLEINLWGNPGLCKAYKAFLANGSTTITDDGYYQADYYEEIQGEEYGQSYTMVFSQDAEVFYDDSYEIGTGYSEFDPWYDVLSEYDVDDDGMLSDDELAAVTRVDLNFWYYDSLDGIERLINLEVLNASGLYQLTSADLSKNTKLKELTFYAPGLTELDLSSNTELIKADICGSFETLDFSGNTKLETLTVNGYLGEELFSMEGLEALKSLTLYECSLSDVSGVAALTGLEELSLSCTAVTTLDVSTLTNLKRLNCFDGVLESITGLDNLTLLEELSLGINKLTALDVSGLSNLKVFYCYSNQLTSLKVGTQTFEIFAADTNKDLQSIDGFENITVTKSLGVSQTSIGSLDVSRFTDLQYLYCYDCGLEELNIDANTELLLLDCSLNSIAELAITNNTKLFNLYCSGNAIASLDITQNPSLLMAARGSRTVDKDGDYLYENGVGGFSLYGMPLTRSLYIDKTTELIQGENEPTPEEQATIEMFPDPAFRNYVLTEFDADYNCVIDAEELAEIANCEKIEVGGRGIRNLTGIAYFTGLKALYAGANELTSLDISENKNLSALSVPRNKLESVDITGIPGLITAHFGTLSELVLKDENDPAVKYPIDAYFYYSEDGPDYALDVDAGVKIIRPYSTEELATIELFPDHNFRSYVLSYFDANGDRAIDEEEFETIAACTSVMVGSMNIRSLAGIEYFTGITELRCENNKLTELDISKNTLLNTLSCQDNNIETLNLTGINDLLGLCKYGIKSESTTEYFNYVTQESYETVYDWYYYVEDDYPFLEVDKDTVIEGLQLSEEEQAVLDMFPDSLFRRIVLGMFDVDSNYVLDENEMAAIAARQSLDVSQEGIADLTGIEYFTGLTYLDCWDNELTTLDVSSNTALKYLRCSLNNLTELNVSANTELVYLNCSDNGLTSLDISQNKKLIYVDCYLNNLTELDISGVPNLLDTYFADMTPVHSPVPAPTEEDPDASVEHLIYSYQNFAISTDDFGYTLYGGLSIDHGVKVITNLPFYSGIRMVLSEEIGLQFAVTLPEGFAFDTPVGSQFMRFIIGYDKVGEYGTGSEVIIQISEAEIISDDTYVFTLGLNPLQFADTIMAQFTWAYFDEDNPDEINYRYLYTYISAEMYCDKLDLTDELQDLVTSLKEYAYAVSQTNWSDGREHLAVDVEMDELTAEELNDLKECVLAELEESGAPIQVNLAGSGISDVQISLSLVNKTILNIYVLPEDGVEVNDYADTREIGGQTYYLFKSEPIGPLNLGLMKEYSISTSAGTAVINACPLSYVYSFMSVSPDNAKILAMAKYYEYYKSAVAYQNRIQ